MIRVVLDTNIIISGLFWRGLPQQIYREAAGGRCVVLMSEALLDELRSTLEKQKFTTHLAGLNLTVDEILAEVQKLSELVIASDVPPDMVRDPKDWVVLACAVGGKADCIVSGDKDLLTLSVYENTPILTAAQFLERLSTQ